MLLYYCFLYCLTVATFPATYTLQQLGRSLQKNEKLFNVCLARSNFAPIHLPRRNTPPYGTHHLCVAILTTKHILTICAQEHLTADHPCKYPNCLARPRCHHPQMKCAACQGLHKASDQNCPARARAIERAKQVRLFGPNMNHPEPHLSRPTSNLGSIEVAHTQLKRNQEDHGSISDQEMDDADLTELMADVSPQLEEEIPETQL
jgi:hypothetical protein